LSGAAQNFFVQYASLKVFGKYGQGGALGLATYLRIGSNLEI
jgi:hypothetical protein